MPAAKGRPASRAARQAWNGGLVGEAKPARPVAPSGGSCGSTRCGTVHTGGRAPAGMTRVPGHGTDQARIYCRGWCATYGQALTDVRGLR